MTHAGQLFDGRRRRVRSLCRSDSPAVVAEGARRCSAAPGSDRGRGAHDECRGRRNAGRRPRIPARRRLLAGGRPQQPHGRRRTAVPARARHPGVAVRGHHDHRGDDHAPAVAAVRGVHSEADRQQGDQTTARPHAREPGRPADPALGGEIPAGTAAGQVPRADERPQPTARRGFHGRVRGVRVRPGRASGAGPVLRVVPHLHAHQRQPGGAGAVAT